MRSTFLCVSSLVCLLLLVSLACGQGVGTSGEIAGTVVDSTGAVVTKVTVTAMDKAKGIQHSTVTDENGHYRFNGIPPAVYDVTAQGGGLASEIHKNVRSEEHTSELQSRQYLV